MAKKGGLKPRRVKNKEERQRPSVFLRLKTDESFRAIALFEPDPELEDNPGFYEYFSHWDEQANTYVPCAGEDCPFCAANRNPSTQAMTVWYFPENDKKDQFKVFTMNNSTVRDVADTAEEEGSIVGKKFRVKRLSDDGSYKVVPVSGTKALTKKEVKTLMSSVEALALEEIVMRQLKSQWERLKALSSLADDDDDEDEEEDDEPISKKGKAKAKPEPEEEDEEEEEDEPDEEDEEDESDDEESEDEEDEESEDEEDEESEDEDEEEEGDTLEGVTLTVTKTDEKNEIISVKDEEGTKFDIWLAQGLEIDFDEVKKGVEIVVDAVKDEEGDFVGTSIEVVKKGKGKGKKAKK